MTILTASTSFALLWSAGWATIGSVAVFFVLSSGRGITGWGRRHYLAGALSVWAAVFAALLALWLLDVWG